MQEIINCPSCQRKLRVPESLVGQDVQCPTCGVTFVATIGEPTSGETSVPPPLPDLGSLPHQRPVHEPEREHRPPASRRRREEDIDDFEEDFDEYGEPRPRKRRRDLMPHRGGTILTLGIIALVGWFMCVIPGIILGPIAWIMGNQDIAEIRAGRMDPEGEGNVTAGRICGIIATILGLLGMCAICGFFGLALIGA